MWISQVICTPVTVLSPKRVPWSIMHVCRECSWLYEFTTDSKGPGLLRTCTHQQLSYYKHSFLKQQNSLFLAETADCPCIISLFIQVVSCSQGPFWLCFPNGKEHRKSVMKHMLYPYRALREMPSACLSCETWHWIPVHSVQFCHALLHLME